MIIKKFQAKTEADAVEAAKKELGDNVVIMNVRKAKRKGIFALFGSHMTEVTAALEEQQEAYHGAVKKAPAADLHKEQPVLGPVNTLEEKTQNALEEKLDSLQSLLMQQMLKNDSMETEEERNGEENSSKTEVQDVPPTEVEKFIKLLYNTMLDNEVDERYANEILREAEKLQKPNVPFDHVLAGIYQKMILKFGQAEEIIPSQDGPKVVLFLGPTGVGKTTTIAKLASKFCVENKKKVALLTADTYRIAAAEQLRTYANILKVPFRVIYTEEELETAIHDFSEFDYIFVDTAGHSHQNQEQKENVGGLIQVVDKMTEKDIFLVVSATTKYKDLLEIANAYKEICDYKFIFTKLDETSAYGNLLNLRLHTQSALSYVTCGQNVPDDIEAFNPQKTVKKLLGGKR